MKTGIIIQARRSSTRLKDKILMELPAGSNISMLGRVIMRAKKACSTVVLATSDHEDDDLTEKEALKYGAEVYRGSLDDVLMRYIKAAEKYGIERIVRITADCPCIDDEVIKECIKLHENSSVDYVSNVEKRTFPHGLDTEVISLSALKRIDSEEKNIKVREHVTWHARKSEDYSKLDYIEKNGKNYSDIRVTVDTYEDYGLMSLIYFMLGDDFTYQDIVNLFEKYPWLKVLNNNIYQKYVFKNRHEELVEAAKLLELNGMTAAKKIIEENI